MTDYEPKSYYDIQLTKKQIFVLFIAGIAILTLVFFLGLMLGKSYMEAKYAQQQKPVENKISEYQPKEIKPIPETEQSDSKKQYEFYKLKESSTQQQEKQEEKPNIISPAKKTEKSQFKDTQPIKSQEYYALQIYAFKDEKTAINKKNYFVKKGYSVDVKFIDNFYKIRIGKFNTKDEALSFKKKFEKQEKITAYIVKY